MNQSINTTEIDWYMIDRFINTRLQCTDTVQLEHTVSAGTSTYAHAHVSCRNFLPGEVAVTSSCRDLLHGESPMKMQQCWMLSQLNTSHTEQNFCLTMWRDLHARTLHVLKNCLAKSVSVVLARKEQCSVRLDKFGGPPTRSVSLWKT